MNQELKHRIQVGQVMEIKNSLLVRKGSEEEQGSNSKTSGQFNLFIWQDKKRKYHMDFLHLESGAIAH